LLAAGAQLSYPALTAYCRRQGIGQQAKAPAGQYHFQPGQELQHDTSPYQVEIGERVRSVQIASAVLCYSRLLFCQFYPTFQRFDCKVFLTEALRYFGGACKSVMIDNTSVVVLRGTGTGMVPVPAIPTTSDGNSGPFRPPMTMRWSELPRRNSASGRSAHPAHTPGTPSAWMMLIPPSESL
jgi:hypothetical protein